jgi:putative ABC transport system permease protein
MKRWWRRKREFEAEMSEELRDHLEQQTAVNIAVGMTPEEARRQARRQLGAVEGVKESCREERRGFWLETLCADVRYGLRIMRRNPGFSCVAVLTLALGIGANTAIFSLIDAILLRVLPVRSPGQLVEVMPADRHGDNAGMSLVTLEEIEGQQRVFSTMFGWWGDAIVNAEIRGSLERVDLYAVDGKFYTELGASPYLGRLIVPGDVNLHGGAPVQVAVLGYDFWRSRFGGDPGLVGTTIRIEDVPFEVVGVSRQGFTGLSASLEPEITIPLTAEPIVFGNRSERVYDRKWQGLDVTARLKDGVTFEQAKAQLEALWPNVQQETVPGDYSAAERQDFLANRLEVKRAGRGFSVLHKRFVEPLYVLMGIAGLVLLIACVNLASLLVSRAAARSHEIGVRLALGASRGRLVSQLLTEAVILSAAGGAAGLGLAYWGSHALADFVLSQIFIVPARLNLAPDGRILGFTIGAALLTGILFGLAPAVSATRRDASSALQESSRVAASGLRPGKILVCTQVALSLVLLMCAALFVRSLARLRATKPGFRTDNVLMASLFPKPNGYKGLDNGAYYRQLLERVGQVPGVAEAGISHGGPLTPLEWKVTLTAGSGGAGQANFDADVKMFSPGTFHALGMKIEQGRDFSWGDGEHGPRVAIVSENLAKELFPRGDAIGAHITVEPGDGALDPGTLRVIGVVNNASMWNLRERNSAELYVPALQRYIQYGELLVRANVDPRALTASVRQAVESMGHEYVTEARPLAEHVERTLLQERVTSLLSAFFGGLALLLASIGLYGLMSYAVARRTREIGIRMALGAQRRSVSWMVLRQALALVLAGIAVGIPCALGATRLIANQLFGLSARDPLTLAFVAVVLLAVGAVAGYLPARRATRVDPIVALKYE